MLAYLRWTFYHILRDIFDMVGIEGLRPDFTSNLVHELAFGTPKFYIAPCGKIKHELVNLSSKCDVKSGLRAKMAKKGKSVNTGKHRESSTNFLFCRCQLLSAEGKEVGDDILRCLPVFVDVYLFAFSLKTYVFHKSSVQ